MEYPPRHLKTFLACALVAGLFFYIGYNTGEEHTLQSMPAVVANASSGQPVNIDFSPFWKAWNIINLKYVPPVSTSTKEVTDEAKVWGAIQGLTSSLGDPYTVFFPPVENTIFKTDIKGNFEGVGMEIVSQNGALTVVAPLKGSPAERAGVLAGDIILRINGQDTSNLSTEEAVQVIRGPKGTEITLTIVRKGARAPIEVKVTRDVINLPVIDARSLGDGIFYIALYSFTENSPDLFRGALRDFVESGDTKLVIDLRGNPGGYLDAAIDMASWFLPAGKAVVRESFGEGKQEQVFRSKGYNVFNDNLKLAILINGGSASASEILAGALSEHGRATLIGEKTFGKGSVQELVDITDKTSLKVTIAHWLTPNGNFISGQGIKPAIEVGRTQEDAKAGEDPQLDRAIEFLNTGK